MLKLWWELVSPYMQWAALIRARVLFKGAYIQHHISSSIWTGPEAYLNTVLANCRWLLGDGCSINFWSDRWLSQPIIDFLQLPPSMNSSLNAKVKDFIQDGNWKIHSMLLSRSSSLIAELNKLSSQNLMQRMFWFGAVVTRALYLSKKHFPCCRSIISRKSFLIWRIIHEKIPIDENLWLWGCIVVSICSLCGCHYETSIHLFLQCWYARTLWSWFGNCLSLNIDVSSIISILSLCIRIGAHLCTIL